MEDVAVIFPRHQPALGWGVWQPFADTAGDGVVGDFDFACHDRTLTFRVSHSCRRGGCAMRIEMGFRPFHTNARQSGACDSKLGKLCSPEQPQRGASRFTFFDGALMWLDKAARRPWTPCAKPIGRLGLGVMTPAPSN